MVMHTAHDSICHSTDNKADYCVHNKAWMKIAGPAAGPLGDVFFGSSVVVQSEITAAGRKEKQVKAQKIDMANSNQTVEEHSVSVGVYNASMPTPQGQRADGVKPQTVAASKIIIKQPDGAQKCIKVLRAYRIVLLGETGAGKSTLGNTIFGEAMFKPGRTTEYHIQSKSAHERRITVLDTPGFTNADQPEGELKDEIARCTSRFLPGPHVFLIVLNVGKSPEEQLAVFDKISKCYSEEAFRYAAVVFTHADQLPEKNIEQYINKNQSLKDLVMKCTGQYLPIELKCSPGDEKYKIQMLQLINIIDKIVIENKGGCYNNNMFQAHKRNKDSTKSGNPTESNTNNRANSLWMNFSGPEGKLVTEAFFGSAVSQRVQRSLKTEETEECPSTTRQQEEYKAPYSEPNDTAEEKYTKTENDQASKEAPKAGKQEVPKKIGDSEAEPGKAEREKNETTKETAKQGGFIENVLGLLLLWGAATAVGGALLATLKFSSLPAALKGVEKVVRDVLKAIKRRKRTKADPGGPTESSGSEPTSEAGRAGAKGSGNGSGGPVELCTKGVGAASAVGAVAWVTNKIKQLICLYNIIKENIGIVLLVVAFCILLLLSFCARVPMAGTILISGGVLVMFLIILLLLIAMMK